MNTNTFDVMDVDKDKILSYPECIAFINQIMEIQEIKQNILSHFDNQTIDDDQHQYFIEYMVQSMYFDHFDLNGNGYIKYNDFLSISSKIEFDSYPKNDTDKMSKNEFFNLILSHNMFSWNHHLKYLFGSNQYKNVMNELSKIKISQNHVNNVDVHLCPFNNINKKRNLLLVTDCCYVRYVCYFGRCYYECYC